MTELKRLVEGLRRAVQARGNAALFRAAREHQAPLAKFEGVDGVLAALADTHEDTYPERDVITRALLSEHSNAKTTLWSSILCVAYCPMLIRLRRRLIGDSMPPDDLDQLVLMAFMSTVAELSERLPPDRIAMRLRQRTERQVFATLRRERSEQHLPLDLDDLSLSPDAERLGVGTEGGAELLRVALAATELVERAAPRVSPGGLNLVVATLLQREPLRVYVSRIYPVENEQRERVYQRLKRQRTRALRRLRALAAESPEKPAGTLLS